jgi:hypothetical protein
LLRLSTAKLFKLYDSTFLGEFANRDFHFDSSQEYCMNKLVFASAMALAGLCLVSSPALPAHGQTIQIQDPAEFNSYQNATTQNDPAQKCAALDSFLKTYPQSTAKSAALDQMIDCYQQTGQMDNLLSAANRVLQIDPNNMKAIFVSVFAKKAQWSEYRSADVRRRRGAGPEGPHGSQTCGHVGRRLEESDHRHLPDLPLGDRL